MCPLISSNAERFPLLSLTVDGVLDLWCSTFDSRNKRISFASSLWQFRYSAPFQWKSLEAQLREETHRRTMTRIMVSIDTLSNFESCLFLAFAFVSKCFVSVANHGVEICWAEIIHDAEQNHVLIKRTNHRKFR